MLTQLIGLPCAEAAAVAGCPVGTLRSPVARARADPMELMSVAAGDEGDTARAWLGFRIMRTLGRRLTQLFAVPVSTTHITTTSITGVGSTRRLSAVRWGVAGSIGLAWIVTLPAAGAVAAGASFLTDVAVG